MKIRCKNQTRPKNTVVPFGHKGKPGYVEYEFKPIDQKLHREDLNNPHICDVLIPAHINALLAVPEAYAEYTEGVVIEEQDDSSNSDSKEVGGLENEFDNLTAWDAEKMNEDDLHRFAVKVMQVHPKQKAGIIACMKTALGIKKVNESDTCQALLRQSAAKMIGQAKTLAKEAEARDKAEKAEAKRIKEADEKAVAEARAAELAATEAAKQK